MFNEETTVEQLILDTLCGKVAQFTVGEKPSPAYGGRFKGWQYIHAENLPRQYSDVFVEPMLREALIRLNPEIKLQPDLADEVLYRLRPIPLSVQSTGLVRANELFTEWLRGEKTMPFGENNEHTPVRLIDFENVTNNEFVVTNQWVYPTQEGGRRFDIVLLVNGLPLIIGEAKTPVRNAVTWVDGANDIHNGYEKSVPQMFVSNIFSFATEGKLPVRLYSYAARYMGPLAPTRQQGGRNPRGRATLSE